MDSFRLVVCVLNQKSWRVRRVVRLLSPLIVTGLTIFLSGRCAYRFPEVVSNPDTNPEIC